MLIYNYHPDSGEFLGAAEADPDPMQAGEFLIPGNATTIEPPGDPAPGFAMTFNGADWVEIEDHRGETWWDGNGQPMTINQIGNPLDHGLVAEGPSPPEPLKLGKLRFALVFEGIVVQTLEAECPMQWKLIEGSRMVVDENDEAQPGYIFDGNKFLPPQEPIE